MGRRLAGLLAGREIILLHGGLGAGKTCFVRGLAEGLGTGQDTSVVSPTFTLINEYPGPIPLFHVDLYRLEGPGEIRGLGLEEYFGRGVTAVEWAERLPPELRQPSLEVTFIVRSEQKREILVHARDPEATDILKRLRRRSQDSKKPG